jgi:hypothetical protein
MATQNKKKNKIIKLKMCVLEFGLPKFVEKEFKYVPWDELMKEEQNGHTK